MVDPKAENRCAGKQPGAQGFWRDARSYLRVRYHTIPSSAQLVMLRCRYMWISLRTWGTMWSNLKRRHLGFAFSVRFITIMLACAVVVMKQRHNQVKGLFPLLRAARKISNSLNTFWSAPCLRHLLQPCRIGIECHG